MVPRPAAKAIEIEDVEARVSDLERRRSAEEVMKAALLKQPAPPRAITSLATCASGCFTASHSQAENYHEIYARGNGTPSDRGVG